MQDRRIVSEGPGLKPPAEMGFFSAPLARPGASAAQQLDYSAMIWLKRRDRMERSQQRCIAVFALVCCFAVLVALIFSAVDVWGEDEDGVTEENCSKDCRIVLVENIPGELSFNSSNHVSLTVGLNHLLDQAKLSIEIVSPYWDLTSIDQESRHYSAYQGQYLFQRLLSLKSRGVKLKIVRDQPDSICNDRYAEERYVNMTALTRGRLLSSFWVVDRKHIYIGSAGMNWKALSKLKELGVIVYDCSCLALDLHRIFSFYWQLHYRDYIPSIWSKRVTAVFSRDKPLQLRLNNTDASAYVSASPDLFCPKGRSRDIDAIRHVIREAKRFIYISVTDYLPLVNRTFRGSAIIRYWSPIDEMLREAAVLREVKVRLLIGLWTRTHPLTFNFMSSMQALCTGLPVCSIEVRFYRGKEQMGGFQHRINENKFMVTDNAIYIGNLDWVGSEFAVNAGAGLVIQESENQQKGQDSIVEQLTGAFERDWFSPYTISLLSGSTTLQESQHWRQKLQSLKTKAESREHE
ncbi:inactive phospholipase D5 isoform X1 [Rhinichthys klamathensis goyatoka]|uniref:inactive phospholipase D5 isoform X1 n=1 Tax=Rhinichthys klamathensis goyatoka TaxID=3034132 RepID=UPI0024B5FE1A|nr:inactive phospholipase D5 isoform X1 [Rhinichthys klamathensis goyatoka]